MSGEPVSDVELETAAEDRPPAEFRPTPFGRGTMHADDVRRLAKPERAPPPKVTGAQLAEAAKKAGAARVAYEAAQKRTLAAMDEELRLSTDYATANEEWRGAIRGYERAAKERAVSEAGT